MYKVRIKSRFSSAHSLKGYDGVCKNIHGHNWTVDVEVKGNELDEIGILIDFTILQKIVDEKVLELDHIYMNELPAFKKDNPTSENIARYLYKELKETLKGHKLVVSEVTVWETEDYRATYTEE